MIRNAMALIAFSLLLGCGDGNPFSEVVDDDDDPVIDIPESIASNVTSFSYNPAAGTLTLTGPLRDEDELPTTFTRKPALDRGPYQAFTAQDDPLDEHTTVYVRAKGDVQAAVGVTGGQFTYYTGGANYGRTGPFQAVPASEASDTGLVTYAGPYVGLTNINGPDTDLLPVPAGVSGDVAPGQSAPITGRIFINVGFDDNNLAGEIYGRQLETSAGTVAASNLVLVPTELTADGTFVGNVEVKGSRSDIGDYAGVIGANNGAAMAGGLFAADHLGQDTEEYGIFVLGRCNGPLEDPSPECAAVE